MCFNLKFDLRAIIDNNEAIDFAHWFGIFFSSMGTHCRFATHLTRSAVRRCSTERVFSVKFNFY